MNVSHLVAGRDNWGLRHAWGRLLAAKPGIWRLRRNLIRRLAMATLVLSVCDGFQTYLQAEQAGSRHAGASGRGTPSSFRGSASDIVFEHLNETAGLANPVTTAFAEDGDGFLWVGTQSGLQRWDGYRFWGYKTKLGDPESLPDNLVQALCADSRGRLWVGTNSGGVARYDRERERFVRYQSYSKDPGHVTVNAIVDDGGHGLWIATDGGLDHLDTETGKFQAVPLAADDGQQPRRAISLARMLDGTLLVGTDVGLERSIGLGSGDASKREFMPVSIPPSKFTPTTVLSLFRDHTGRVWVGTQGGVYIFEGAGVGLRPGPIRLQSVTGKGDDSGLLSTLRYLSIAETSQGEIWLGTTDSGIVAVTPTDGGTGPWAVRHISQDPAVSTTLSDDQMQALYLDHAGTMWLATRRGVNYLDTTPKSAFTIAGGGGHSNTIRDSDIYSVLARRDGSVWLGLSKQGIDILDANGTKTAELRSRPEGSAASGVALPYGAISGMTEADENTVYISTQKGLFRARTSDSAGKSSPPQLTRIALSKDASEDSARVVSDQGVLWIGSASGLWTLEPESSDGPSKRVELQQPLTDRHVSAMLRGAGDDLWVGTQNGLNRVDIKTRAVEAILPDPADAQALGGGFISSLLIDKKGRLWVGTFTGGIDILTGHDAQGRARFHRIIDGLPNENIDMLLQGPDGKIWASTDAGLAVIDQDTFAIEVLSRADGAALATHWNGSGATTKGGDLLFGALGGLTVARPEMMKPWTYQPPVLVTSARIGMSDVPISRFNSGLGEYPVWIPPDQNNLTVEFAALDYTAPERNRYEYRLEGFDHDWIAAESSRRVARYTNLPPGDYTLQLRGSNRDGAWAPAREVRIRVLPAWNQKTWFRVLVVILALLCLWGLFLLGTAYLRRQQRELERQVALRTAELEQKTVELKESQRQLEHMAYTDTLTGLPNRRMFNEAFRRLLALKRRQEGVFALLLMDFDDFKEINDTYGHDAGDAVLKEMALRMSSLVRESDCLARLGGDEFGLLLGQSPDIEATESVCRKIVESFEEPVYFEGLELRTAPSVGVALYPQDGDAQESLFKMADMAMYQAKRNGGNSCRWCREEPTTYQIQ